MFDIAMRTFSTNNSVTYTVDADERCLEFKFPEFADGYPIYQQIHDLLIQIPQTRSFHRIYNRLEYSGHISVGEIRSFSLKDYPAVHGRIMVLVSNDPLIVDRFKSGLYDELFPYARVFLSSTIEDARGIIHGLSK